MTGPANPPLQADEGRQRSQLVRTLGATFASFRPRALSPSRLSGLLLYSHANAVQFSTLTLDWRTRQGGGGKTQRDHLDFVVDGRSLLDRLPPVDNVGVLGWGPPEVEASAIAQLLLRQPSEMPGGRVPLYVCAECGDLGCGAVTAHVEKTSDAFVWSDLAWEVNYHFEPDDDGILRRYDDVGPFTFQKTEYWNVLNNRLTQVAV